MSHKLEQLEFKLEKLLGFRNVQEKLEKCIALLLGGRFCNTFLLIFKLNFFLSQKP